MKGTCDREKFSNLLQRCDRFESRQNRPSTAISKAEDGMKIFSKFALIAVLALCSAVAFAGEKQSINLNFYQDSVIAGVKVPAGEYKMLVARDGQNAQFTLMRGKAKIVETGARFVELASFSAPMAVVTEGGTKVARIEVSKLKGAIVFDQAPQVAGGK